jgi:CHASE3 domain sensor protein
MRLRQRLVFTFLVITLIVIAPAIWGLFALRELREVAYNLSTRDAVGALTLGRLQTAFGEVENSQRIYLALGTPEAREQVEESSARVSRELRNLSEGGYRAVAAPAIRVERPPPRRSRRSSAWWRRGGGAR